MADLGLTCKGRKACRYIVFEQLLQIGLPVSHQAKKEELWEVSKREGALADAATDVHYTEYVASAPLTPSQYSCTRLVHVKKQDISQCA
jgi:hypothetical protein